MNKIPLAFLLTALFLLCASVASKAAPMPAAHLQQTGERDSIVISPINIHIDFPINSSQVLEGWGHNRQALDSLRNLLQHSQQSAIISIENMEVSGTASPDGNMNSNNRLARRRMEALRNYIINNFGVDTESISIGESYIPWQEFREMIAASEIAEKDRILEICNTGSDTSAIDTRWRLDALKRLNGGKTWRILASNIFTKLRRASFKANKEQHLKVPVYVMIEEPDEVIPEVTIVEEESEVLSDSIFQPAKCRKTWHLSTNALAWAMAVTNITGEWDFACHWSLAASIYYSGWNYGKVTRKFRLFLVRPEVRWWLNQDHKGFFIDAHLQFAYYNFALPNWDYRIQDKRARHPAPGGGIGAGYRLNISKNGHWSAEAAIGCGVYSLKYDRFENRQNGPFVDCKKKTWFGIDNAALSIVYNF